MTLLTGRFSSDSTTADAMQFQVGANMDQNVNAYIGTMTAQALGLRNISDNAQLTISTPDTANIAIGTLDNALKIVNKQRADLGAYQNRFEMASDGIGIAAENLQSAESRIRDTDMAEAMVDYTKNSILTQAGTAMLAQANSQSQNVLALLQ
jgi:flagellin